MISSDLFGIEKSFKSIEMHFHELHENISQQFVKNFKSSLIMILEL